MNLINFYYIFLLFGISQGLFLALAIPFSKNTNNPANKVLAIIILLATIMLAGRILYSALNDEWVIRLAGLVDTTLFLFGPLIYLYIIKLSKGNFIFSKSHYIPALLHLIYVGATFSFSLSELNQFYFNGPLRLIIASIEGLGLVSLCTYIVLSFFHLRKTTSSKLFFGSKNSLTTKRYLFRFLGIFSVLATIWLLSFTLSISGINLSFISYDIFWMITPVIFYIVGYFSLSSPEILRDSLKKSIANRKRLNPNEIQELRSKLKFLIEEEQVYLNSDLTLKDLSEQLNTSSNNLSWYLNHVHQKSFYDFINQTRINAFKEKIERKEHQKHTLLALAMDVGFNSKSTFNKAFKSLIGDTPSDYVKNHS
ncbi:helix-turn-helix domain-containing protein [Ekhidna sp.]